MARIVYKDYWRQNYTRFVRGKISGDKVDFYFHGEWRPSSTFEEWDWL